MTRGTVVLVRVPHASGTRGKRRPAVVVQSDAYLGVVRSLVLAEVTTNLAMATDAACLFIDITTPDGQQTGLSQDSVVTGLLLYTVYADLIDQTLGTLTPALLAKLDGCLRAALGLP